MARFAPGKFINEVKIETAKIVWPTRKQTAMTALMVVIMTLILALFFFAVDTFFGAIVHKLLSLLS